MKFVFDHHALQYMLEQFPRNITKAYWIQFLEACEDGTIIAHRETRKLLEQAAIEPDSLKWCKENAFLFKPTTEAEANLLGQWMRQGVFAFLETASFVRGRMPEDIPFMLCMAERQNRCYVYRKNTNMRSFPPVKEICEEYGITFMEAEECLLNLAKR